MRGVLYGFLGAGPVSLLPPSLTFCCGDMVSIWRKCSNFINFASNVFLVAFFIFGGKMIWSLGLVMFVGQSLGARLRCNGGAGAR
ncbi:TSUP family transporter [Salmonella enterica subsp. enterica]|nr:TSUP family transporter [Salmonella enterica subsp. enterica]